jgi:hypothetical protein
LKLGRLDLAGGSRQRNLSAAGSLELGRGRKLGSSQSRGAPGTHTGLLLAPLSPWEDEGSTVWFL